MPRYPLAETARQIADPAQRDSFARSCLFKFKTDGIDGCLAMTRWGRGAA